MDITTPLSFAAGTSHTLYSSSGRLLGIVANDQIHLANVDSFLSNASRNEHIVYSSPEFLPKCYL